jgi:transposase InsO family protein
LVIVDAYSKYPEVFAMNSTTSTATIKKLRYLFTRHGLPTLLVSDNGTQFASKEFQRFCKSNGIEHMFSPPYVPQSNGQAERFVDTFKRAFTKLKEEGETPQDLMVETFLATYRSIPNPTLDGKCPAELFIGRKPRTSIDLLKPPVLPTERNFKMEQQFNRKHGAKPREFDIGATVYARYRKSMPWTPGTVKERNGLIYIVDYEENGESHRCHVNQLLPRTLKTTESRALEMFNETFALPPSPPSENREPRRNPVRSCRQR